MSGWVLEMLVRGYFYYLPILGKDKWWRLLVSTPEKNLGCLAETKI